MTPSERIQERNRRANAYRREAHEKWGICSPFRQGLYIGARLAGKTPEEAKVFAIEIWNAKRQPA